MIVTGTPLSAVRGKTPLVHFITNYVTVNDCANITLACGGSPVMADEAEEVEEIVSLASALVLNIGTINTRTLMSMVRAGKHANSLGIPVILDPVGAGASQFRNNAAALLLKDVRFTAIKGNISEVKCLAHGVAAMQGVDAVVSDLVTERNLEEAARLARKLSAMTGAVIVITGPVDLVADGRNGYALFNGHPMMSTVTGTGCMAAAVGGCFLGADAADPLSAMLAATGTMGICGELGHEAALCQGGGNASLRSWIIDAMCALSDEVLAKRLKVRQVF